MMLQRPRNGYARTRTTPRDAWRAPAMVDAVAAKMASARRAAVAFIRSRWPELADVVPTLSTRKAHAPSPELLERLGLDKGEIAHRQDVPLYTFTFAGTRRTADGNQAPLVAAVTVDERQQIVKASVTR
jgi:hypothetical protein